MSLDYYELKNMRKNHPSWRLMAAENAPLIATFLESVFSDVKIRQIGESELLMRLEDFLYNLREEKEDFPRSATEYLGDWSRNDRGWLRKFYPPGIDEPHYDLTPSCEKAIGWLLSLFERNFIGTESRLHSSIELLRQIAHGMEEDQDLRIQRLEEKRKLIDQEIKAIKNGEVIFLDSREIRERFLQFERQSGDILSDFRAVEQNFKDLDRQTREKIATWNGDKSSLLKTLFTEHDVIFHSDEGMSFTAFWDFLMSPSSQEEMTSLLDEVCKLKAVRELKESGKYKKIHFDWIQAGDRTQRMVAQLSQQLRRFLDDRAYYENRRISSILDQIESHSVAIRDKNPEGNFIALDGIKAEIRLPMEQPLFTPPEKVDLQSSVTLEEIEEIDDKALFNQVVVDKGLLKRNIETLLQKKGQISLWGIIEEYPLKEGLAELITYLAIGEEEDSALVDEKSREEIRWVDREGIVRGARIPQIIFNRKNNGNKR